MHDPFVLAFVAGATPGKWAGIWNERMPSTPLVLRPTAAGDAMAAVRSGDADVALVRLPVEQTSLAVIPLYREKAVVVAPVEHVLEAFETVLLADLSDENLLHGADAGTVELVAAGLGIAIMPQSIARALSRKDVFSRIITDAQETQMALIWLDGNTDPLIQEFIGIVRGRTANSSRGAGATTEEVPPSPAPKSRPKKAAASPAATRRRRR